MNLDRLSQSVHTTEGLILDVFLTIKTHKPDQPRRAIVSERGTSQVVVSAFLKRELHKLHELDAFELRNCDATVDDLQSGALDGCKAFSVDFENLDYSLPHQDLLACVKACSAKDNDEHNSCVAHVLSRIFLERVDVSVKECHQDECRIYRYVDHYLVFVRGEEPKYELHDFLNVFDKCGMGLTFKFEQAVEGCLQFLDLKLDVSNQHLCWRYHPPSEKPLLRYSSGHSKTVKRGIAMSCFGSAVKKSCEHLAGESFAEQITRLKVAGFPPSVLSAVCGGLVRQMKLKFPEEGK